MTPFERSFSKLSENHKIVEMGSTEFKLWQLKESPNHCLEAIVGTSNNYLYCRLFLPPSLDTPTDRHVRNWACSFHALLSDVTGRQVFEEFCKSQYNHENVRFWQSCQDLKSIPLKAIPGSIRLIYE